MTIHARFLPKYPKRINVTDGLTKTEANGVVTLGFDYVNSEFGAELQQTLTSVAAYDASAAAHDTAAAASATASAASATAAAASADAAAVFATRIGVIANLTALKALTPYTDAVLYMQGYATNGDGGEGIFNWRTGDFSANITADALGAIYVKADSVAATDGAWVRKGGWAIAGVDFGWLGGIMNSTTAAETNCAALQQASNNGWRANIPAGTLYLALVKTIAVEGGSTSCAVEVKTGFRMHGQGRGVSIIKLRDNESTDATPLWFNVFAGNTVINDLDFQSFTIDVNGANNKINPNRFRTATVTMAVASPGVVTWTAHGLSAGDYFRPTTTGALLTGLTPNTWYYVKSVLSVDTFTISATSGGTAIAFSGTQSGTHTGQGGSYQHYTCAGVMISGSVASAGQDARLYHARFIDVAVNNSPGVTCIGLGSRYNNPGVSGDDIVIDRCSFYNNGLDALDHSSVFAFANGVRVTNCFFDHPSPSTGVQGPVVAIELHGSRNSANNNVVSNYCQLAWIVAGEDGVRSGISVSGNKATVSYFGVGFFSITPWIDGLTDVSIQANEIHVTADVIDHPLLNASRTALYVGIDEGYLLRATILGNNLYCSDRSDNVGITLGVNTGASIGESLVNSNNISGFSEGVVVNSSPGSIYSLQVAINQIMNCAATTKLPTATRGIRVAGSLFSLGLVGNSVGSGDLGTAPLIGIDVAGAATNFHMAANGVRDSVVGISDTIVVSGRRDGEQACTMAAKPTIGTWKVGDYVKNSARAETGTTPSKFIINGWSRVTNGTGAAQTLNTDWFEDRALTGN